MTEFFTAIEQHGWTVVALALIASWLIREWRGR